jgi:hypothetical protein
MSPFPVVSTSLSATTFATMTTTTAAFLSTMPTKRHLFGVPKTAASLRVVDQSFVRKLQRGSSVSTAATDDSSEEFENHSALNKKSLRHKLVSTDDSKNDFCVLSTTPLLLPRNIYFDTLLSHMLFFLSFLRMS